MSIAGNNIKVFLLEQYYEHNLTQFNIHITDMKELSRPDALRGLNELKEANFIDYKKKSQDYFEIKILSDFCKEYNLSMK